MFAYVRLYTYHSGNLGGILTWFNLEPDNSLIRRTGLDDLREWKGGECVTKMMMGMGGV